jgi:uncharacterized protein
MNNKLSLSIDLRIVCVALLVVILAMFAIWQPWQSTSSTRKITVTGTAKVTAEPDMYQFSPSYQKATTEELNTQLNTVTVKLKELGVESKHITVQSSAYGSPQPLNDKTTTIAPAPDRQTNYAYLTIKVSNKELAQKVQDYLATTGAQGQLTSTPSFSDDKQKQLLEQAKEKAIADAKSQGSKTASNLDAKLGKVLEIKDADEYNGPITLEGRSTASVNLDAKASTPIYAGEQDITFQVIVTFELK